MKKLHTAIFSVGFLALFIIVGCMDNCSLSVRNGMVLAIIDFVVIIFSGIKSKMLNFKVEV